MLLLAVSFNVADAQSKTRRTAVRKSITPIIPAEKILQEMTETVLLDFDAAVRNDDFSDFYSKISAFWQRQTSAAALKTVFQEFIDRKVYISEIAERKPKFSPKPMIKKDSGLNILVVQGRYATEPLPVKFILKFIRERNEWKLWGIDVDTTGE